MGFLKPFCIKLGLKKLKVSVLVVGCAGSGKTTIVNSLKPDKEEEIVPTVGFSIERFKFKKSKLTVIDMSGQAKYRKLWDCYYEDAKAVVFVIDAADEGSFPEAATALDEVLSHPHVKAKRLPLLVFANKKDLAKALSAEEVTRDLDLSKKVDLKQTWQVIGSSGVSGEGIENGMKWLYEKLQR
ncbi:hypothetical protein CYMTET_49060 [Cymbomonas tetramitiformis]|uniref:Uncharacterized protein n=1 Tax=Cymbomonas tetramitiformis TaxID=36881 RepID=A0AAE0BSN9_9CHLO|nr:hypothetical protein CYMTET_49060 [Cymbomonas tetramitiformis]